MYVMQDKHAVSPAGVETKPNGPWLEKDIWIFTDVYYLDLKNEAIYI